MNSPSDTPRPDSFTQSCRDLVRTLTYEDILGCTLYAAPMVFMIGPASIIGQTSFIAMVIQSLVGFVLSWMVHRLGHRFVSTLSKEPCRVYVSQARCVPVRLTLTQFLWVMELTVGAAVFAAVLGKRFLHTPDSVGLWSGLILIAFAILLYFVPSHLGKLWIQHYYPAMTLVGPTEDVIKATLPGIRHIFTFTQKH